MIHAPWRVHAAWPGAAMRGIRHVVFALLAGIFALTPRAFAVDSFSFHASDGTRLNYLAKGAGEIIVFVPGWLMPGAIWQEQIEFFSRTHRAIAFDPRSQGESEIARTGNHVARRAEDIAELLAHLRAERVVLVGWSLGVLESLMYLRTHGDARLAALVLVDNSVGEEPPPKRGRTSDLPRQDRKAAVSKFVNSMFATPRPPDYLDWLTAQALRTPAAAAQSLLNLPYPRGFWREALDQTHRPVLYMVTPRLREQADNLQKKRGNTRTEVFQNAGHALFVDEPERFNAAIEKFLQSAGRAP